MTENQPVISNMDSEFLKEDQGVHTVLLLPCCSSMLRSRFSFESRQHFLFRPLLRFTRQSTSDCERHKMDI